MTKQYKSITWVEAAHVLEAGKSVQYKAESGVWYTQLTTNKSVAIGTTYRVEAQAPKQGDQVIATFIDIGGNKSEWPAEFIVEYKGLYICMESDGSVSEFHEVRLVEEPNPVSREWYASVDSIGNLTEAFQPDSVTENYRHKYILVREVLE